MTADSSGFSKLPPENTLQLSLQACVSSTSPRMILVFSSPNTFQVTLISGVGV